MAVDIGLLAQCKKDFDLKVPAYQKMQDYYDNKTDAKRDYKMITSRSSLFTDTNFIQKFIQEESNYCLLNKIVYTSNAGNKGIEDIIRTNFRHYSEGYNKELLKQALIFNEAYELQSTDNLGRFKSMVLTPLNSYVLENDLGDIELFIRYFYKQFDTKTIYADVYSNEGTLTHYTVDGGVFTVFGDEETSLFSRVPIGICKIGTIYESLYSKLRGLQDAYTTNCSDQTNLNSDLRTKYLHFKNCEPSPEQIEAMKEKATITTTGDGDVKWVQSTEVSFVNTLKVLEDDIYQQASHLNFNNPLSSNTSSLALQGTLIGLNQKVGDNITAITDCLKVRLEFLFEYLNIKLGLVYDWKDINIKITTNIPSDNLMASQIISQNPNLSRKTGYSLYSFIDSPEKEEQQKQLEDKANSIGEGLLTGVVK